MVLMESPIWTDTLRSLEGVEGTTVILLNCPTLNNVVYNIFSGPVMQVPWDLGEPRTYTRLQGIGIFALERPLLPLSALRTLENMLTRANIFKSDGVLVKMSVTIRPGWAIMAMLKERDEFAQELAFLEDLDQLGSSGDIFRDTVKH